MHFFDVSKLKKVHFGLHPQKFSRNKYKKGNNIRVLIKLNGLIVGGTSGISEHLEYQIFQPFT